MKTAKAVGGQVSLFGMLKILGVSCSDYHSFSVTSIQSLSYARNELRNESRRSTTALTRTTERQSSPGSCRGKANGFLSVLSAAICGKEGVGPSGVSPGLLPLLTTTSASSCIISWTSSSILIGQLRMVQRYHLHLYPRRIRLPDMFTPRKSLPGYWHPLWRSARVPDGRRRRFHTASLLFCDGNVMSVV